MLEVLICWLWVGISSFLVGMLVLFLLGEDIEKTKDLELTVFIGLCFLTVYAQVFSLFYGVGKMANIILLVTDVLILFFLKQKILSWAQMCIEDSRFKSCLVIVAIFILGISIITSEPMKIYDTYLYYGQSIKWIEDYGVVPGLGNLHNRLAYNSSIFSLGALFSLKFIFNQSLHSINGFFTLVLLCYAICSMKVWKGGGEQRFCISDFLRLGIIFFLNYNLDAVSTTGSDIMSLGLVIYIITKWFSAVEDKCKSSKTYAYLSLLGVYALTIKLSAIMILPLALMPAIMLIREKNYRKIMQYLCCGIIIVSPFLIRNIIISGYILYPYPELDLFSFDWKMPEYTCIFDRNEIKAWGMGIYNVGMYQVPLKEWFPIWYAQLSRGMRLFFYLTIASSIYNILFGIIKKDIVFLLIVSTEIMNIVFWFLSAPLIRYGSIHLIIMPLIASGIIISRAKFINTDIKVVTLIASIGTFCMFPMVHSLLYREEISFMKQADYVECNCEEQKLENFTIYTPKEGDQTGYYSFPSTPYKARLSLIEPRGESLEEGFKMKDEYREGYITTYGDICDTNYFK